MSRKIAAIVLIGLFLAGLACADTAMDDTTVQDLSVLRKKLSRVKREIDLLIKDMVSGASVASDAVLKDFDRDVNIDILQNEKFVIVKADLPGMEKDKISIMLENGRFLKIAGSREMIKTAKSPGVVRQERFFGNFEKVIELPCDVESSGIAAAYKDGVLEIMIPKRAQAKEDRVKIKVN